MRLKKKLYWLIVYVCCRITYQTSKYSNKKITIAKKKLFHTKTSMQSLLDNSTISFEVFCH